MGGAVAEGAVVIVGGTAGLGRELARKYAERGRPAVVAGRDAARAEAVAGEIGGGTRGLALKLVGYTEVLHCLHPGMHDDTSVLLFGGLAKDRPYPGSTTVTSVNGAVATLIRSLAIELAPVRVNAIHPGIVGDSPTWKGRPEVLERVLSRTPTERLITMRDVVEVAVLLLENRSVNGINVEVDGGWLAL